MRLERMLLYKDNYESPENLNILRVDMTFQSYTNKDDTNYVAPTLYIESVMVFMLVSNP